MPKSKVLVFGTFDHLHPGHLFVFKQARQRGDVFIVVARDATVAHIKGRAPDHHEEVRMQAIEQVIPEADVRLGNAADYLEPVRSIQPDLILLGYDQRMPTGVVVEDLPCRVERLPALQPEKYKSSLWRRKELKNDEL